MGKDKVTSYINRKGARCLFIFLYLTLLCIGITPLYAQNSAAISQGFQASNTTNLTPGALVSLVPNESNNIQLANTQTVNQLEGVVGNQPLVELSSSNSQVQVVTSGISGVLVSDINGDVQDGDKITASPINGVGMKATTSSQVVGTAEANFDTVITHNETITDKDGHSHVVHVGMLPVEINVTYFATTQNKKTDIPAFLQQLANTVASKTVSPLRIIVSALALLLGFISIAVMLSASVRSSIISIGRNPLSEETVHKSLIEVGLIALGILLVMVIVVYLILTT